jgi:uncharacterized protein
MSLLNKSRFTIEVPIKRRGGEEILALYHTMTRAFVLIPERQWSYALSDPVAPADPSAMDLLYDQGFLVRETTDETMLFETWMQQYVHDFSTLKSKVLVTRKCNNRCRYCILDPEAKEMSPETARAMDQFYIETIREKNPQRVEDDYLGGEPLLNPGIILDSAARRFYYCLGRGIEYGFVITTNGRLIRPSVIADMKEVGLTGLRVSLAGPAAVHDNLRPSKTNGKTYEVILQNLEAVSGMVPISIECQYDSGAFDFLSYPEMLDDFVERGIAIEDITFTPILPRRGKSAFQSGTGDPRILLYLSEEAEKRGFPQDREAPANACMADFRARFVFDADGSIIPCPSLQGGEMAYGHVTTGVDFVAESELLKRKLPDKCLNQCPMLPICMGGCRLQALTRGNGFNGIDCHREIQRLFLDEYIRHMASAVSVQEGQKDGALRIAA